MLKEYSFIGANTQLKGPILAGALMIVMEMCRLLRGEGHTTWKETWIESLTRLIENAVRNTGDRLWNPARERRRDDLERLFSTQKIKADLGYHPLCILQAQTDSNLGRWQFYKWFES